MVGFGLMASLAARDRFDMTVQHDRNPLFVQLSDGSIRNGFTVKLLNMLGQPRTFELAVDGLEGATLVVPEVNNVPAKSVLIKVAPDKLRALKVFVRQPGKLITPGRQYFKFVARDINGQRK